MKKMKKLLYIFWLMPFSFGILQAQDWEAGGWIGTAVYQGDLRPDFSLKSASPALGVLLRFNLNSRLSFKLSGSYGSVTADDKDSPDEYVRQRNLSFRSPLWDGSAQFEFNFLKYEHGSKHNFSPYLFGGVSIFHFNPQAEYKGRWVELQPMGTEGQYLGSEYRLSQPAFNYGGGFKVDLSYEWSLNVELSMRRLFTDYLDDVSTVYPDYEQLLEDRGEVAVALSNRAVNNTELGETGRQRGNSQDLDRFGFLGVGFVYNFADVKCPWTR